MRQFKMLGVALAAVLAMTAIAAASALAQPEFLNSSGNTSITKKMFSGSAGAGELVGVGGAGVVCSGGSSLGEITGASTVGKVTVLFTGCENKEKTKKCTSKQSGSTAGDIETTSLSGKLGAVSLTEAASGVGLLLSPESGTEFTTVEKCIGGTGKLKVTGSVIGEVSPVGTAHNGSEAKTTGSLNYEATGEVQKIKTFTGSGVNDFLAAFNSVESGMKVNNSITFEEAIEVT